MREVLIRKMFPNWIFFLATQSIPPEEMRRGRDYTVDFPSGRLFRLRPALIGVQTMCLPTVVEGLNIHGIHYTERCHGFDCKKLPPQAGGSGRLPNPLHERRRVCCTHQ
jgi:hypothetical protein